MNKIAIKIATKIIAVLLCISLLGSNMFLVLPSRSDMQPSFSIIQEKEEIEIAKTTKENKINRNVTMNVTTRSGISRKVTEYKLYELIINNKDILYFENEENANNKKVYILDNTTNIEVSINEITVKDKNNVSTEEEISSMVSSYLQKYKKVTTCFPTKSHNITSTFGKRSRGDYHTGIDLAGNYGDNIYAYKSGTVIKVQYSNKSYGNMVLIQHDNGMQTRYAHMSSIKVSNGEKVSCGEIIGHMGSTGNSTGNHLHFEVIINGTAVNPYSYIF